MSCEPTYNLIKEGILTVETGTTIFLDGGDILSLYDGSYDTVAATLLGTPSSVVFRVEFGESFDICYVDYYTTEEDSSRVLISYGTEAAEFSAVVAPSVSGVYRATIDSCATFIEIEHTVSGTTADISQIEVIGTKNETLGFGEEKASEFDRLHLPHATVGTMSASPTVVPLFNDNHFDEVAKVSVAPTLAAVDNYIYVATEKEGPYYGINDYGFRQPGPKHIPLHDDPMQEWFLDPQWTTRFTGGKHSVSPTPEGLIFDSFLVDTYAQSDAAGLLSGLFTVDSSFTIDVDIKFLARYSNDLFDKRQLSMVLSNNYPLPAYGELSAYMSDTRRGGSAGGIAVFPVWAATDPTYNRTFLHWVDGNASENPAAESSWRKFITLSDAPHIGATGGTSFKTYNYEGLWDIEYDGNSMGDYTEAALWHTWRLVYDHRTQEMTGFVDNISLGSYIFRCEPLREGCRLFIGATGRCAYKWALRNFRFRQNKLYRQKNVALSSCGGVPSATISGIESNVSKAVDGDVDTSYVGPNPDSLARFRVDFDRPYDIVYYSLRQREVPTWYSFGIAIFGATYRADIARTVIADYGGKHLEIQKLAYKDYAQLRSPAYSAAPVVASGIEYLDLQFTTYSRTPYGLGALIIEELGIFAEEVVEVDPPLPEDEKQVPWVEGRWHNLKQYGQTNTLAIKDKAIMSTMVSFCPWREFLQVGVDCGFSSVGTDRAFGGHVYPSAGYNFPEGLFAPGNEYSRWWSGTQTDNHFYVWRRFITQSMVGGVYWHQGSFLWGRAARKFKFQYLDDGHDPNLEDSWLDIPPISVPYTRTNTATNRTYKAYVAYLIANNDGEYYTDYDTMPALERSSFYISSNTEAARVSGLIVPTTLASRVVYLQGTSEECMQRGYIEFDLPVRTRGIRIVIHTPVNGAGAIVTDTWLQSFEVFTVGSVGSYLSPVFDTGTPQNTERLKAVIHEVEGTSSAVFVRSSDTPPVRAYDPQFETQEALGIQGDTEGLVTWAPVSTDSIISAGNETYYLTANIPYSYNNLTGVWSIMGGGYPAAGAVSSTDLIEDDGVGSTLSPALKPDTRVTNNSVLLEDGYIYTAAYYTGESRLQRLMRYTFTGTFSGWAQFGGLRPLATEYAAMVAYGRKLYFFNRYGPIYYFDLDSNIWFNPAAQLPAYGGSRWGVLSCVFEDKAYFFGANSGGNKAVNIYDFATETFTDGSPPPFAIPSGRALAYPPSRVIYVLPNHSYYAAMKYYPDEDRWESAPTLLYYGDLEYTHPTGILYYLRDGYIYSLIGGSPLTARAARARVSWDPWVSGKSPAVRDPVWGNASSITETPWQEIDSLGELMPQRRYFQFSAELYSNDRKNSPVLESVNIVLPQEVAVPANGTADVFVKVNVTAAVTYQAWYTGTNSTYQYQSATYGESLIYAQSKDGISWDTATTASGTYYPSLSVWSVGSPWVIEEGGLYRFWFRRSDEGSYSTPRDIHYICSSSPADISKDFLSQEVISAGVVSGTTDVEDPCVVKVGPADYRIWFVGRSGTTYRIFYAVSTDGVAWTSHQRVIDVGEDTVHAYDALGCTRPCVLLENGIFRMWYTATDALGYTRILYRESVDGIVWGAIQLNLDMGAEGENDSQGVSRAFVMYDSGTYRIFYRGWDGSARKLIQASSPDGYGWSSFSVVTPSSIQGYQDFYSISDFLVLVNRDSVASGDVLTSGKLKIYNVGAAL